MINQTALKLRASVHPKMSLGEWKDKPQSGRRYLQSDYGLVAIVCKELSQIN